MTRGPIASFLFLFALPSLALSATKAPAAAEVREKTRAWRAAHEADLLREFVELLKLPNVASDTPNIRRNADAIVALLERAGVRARLLEEAGAPPVDRSRWTGDPWAPVLRDKPLEEGGREMPVEGLEGPLDPEWRLYARSTSDDKTPVIGIAAALDALRAARIPLSVNLKLFFEGEEEAGSPHLEAILRKHADLLKADAWLLCDGPVHQSRRMQVFFGARGTTDLELTVYGPARTLHSGHYGNWAPNPAVLLTHLLAGLRDVDGRVAIAGFYDGVRPMTETERRALAAVPDVDEALRQELALASTEAGGARLVERLMLPALNVRGIEAGRVGENAANAIPSEARASIDFRLVPDLTPARVRERLEAHLAREGWLVVHGTPDLETRRGHPRVVKLEWGEGYPAARTSMDLPISRAVVRVVEEAAGVPIVAVPSLGGSIPMYLFEEVLKAPVVGVPIANHDNNQHAANENIRLRNLWDGIEVYAALLARLGYALPSP